MVSIQKKRRLLNLSGVSFWIVVLTLFLGTIWLLKGPSDQELLANMVKAEDFHPWSGWWCDHFMMGGSVAPSLTTLFTILPLKFFGFLLGPLLGGKVAGLLALASAGFAMNLFLSSWTQDQRTALLGSLAYILGPQFSLRLAFNEHLPVVFSMVDTPLILWSLWVLVVQQRSRGILFLALSYGALILTFTKMAVCFLPIFFGFFLFLIKEQGRELKDFSYILNLFFKIVLTGVLLIPLAILPLLPALREYQWLSLFTYEPFATFQNNFVFQGPLSFLDRNNFLSAGMPPNFRLDYGGFYLGVVTLFLIGYIFYFQKINSIIKTSLCLILLSAWLSLGPSSLASRILFFLASAQSASNISVPLFWFSFLALMVLIWKLSPTFSQKKKTYFLRVLLVLIFLLIPGFRLFESFPFAKGIRAPWSLWQLGGSLFLAALFGSMASRFVSSFRRKLSKKIASLLLILIMLVDFAPYLFFYHQGALAEGTYDDFLDAVAFLRRDSSHRVVMPFSGRYFYLQLPLLTEHPLADEAFNRYFELKWVRSLANNLQAQDFKEFLNLLGVSYLFIDKEDPSTPKQSQQFYRSLYPAVFENSSFLILENKDSLYPAFIAHEIVLFPKESDTLGIFSLQLARMNLLTLRMNEIPSGELGVAGVAKNDHQVELLPNYKEQGGAPWEHLMTSAITMDHQEISVTLLPTISGWFVLTKAFHPDWQATVDGHPTALYRGAGALLTLYIPLNSKEVLLKFQPPFWYTLSFYVGMFSWLLALTFLFLLLQKEWTPQLYFMNKLSEKSIPR